ncbi:uncharacterized protein LOC119837541 [Zerene cesonia]|uniref:uncharacterized protein LOC119837541 n=1 Tax=Zerene cesonia TaxID=33412 RepID=UPI0018E4F831|nr:uncharacterized protein LOC119837541 [Zerene cesonia]
MKQVIIILLLLVFCVCLYDAKDLVVGTRINNLLISTEKVVYKGIPFIRRDKDYNYTDPKARVIKGIIARDLSRTDAEVTLVSGGVGDTHVTLHLRSERGEGLNYLILIFSQNK